MLEQATGDDELPQLNRAEREAISLAACEALGVLMSRARNLTFWRQSGLG